MVLNKIPLSLRYKVNSVSNMKYISRNLFASSRSMVSQRLNFLTRCINYPIYNYSTLRPFTMILKQHKRSLITITNMDTLNNDRITNKTISIPETIYALSTSPGKAGVAIIRISGPLATQVLKTMIRMDPSNKIEPRHAYFKKIYHPSTNIVLDHGLILYFNAPHSFTGEDIIELHIHGGNAVVQGILNALNELPSFRLAEQGEFARRAFDNDKLDLTELEGLADLLNAETEMQRRIALRQAEGGLRIHFEKWRQSIIHAMSLTEAVIDFGEDENIEDGVLDDVTSNIKELRQTINEHLNDNHAGEIIRNGIHIAIVGPPNAGKSSFLNKLIKREAAIVSDIPGTTRDIVEVTMNLGGYSVIISDTAGLRESKDQIEMEGVRRAKARIESSDIKLCLLSGIDLIRHHDQNKKTSDQQEQVLWMDPIIKQVIDHDTFVILNKQDMFNDIISSSELAQRVQLETGAKKVWTISCKTGQDLDLFLKDMIQELKSKFDKSMANPILITQARHRQHLENCLYSLDTFLDMPIEDIVLAAEELRQAANSLGRVTGKIDVEDVLDALFGQFCIGK